MSDIANFKVGTVGKALPETEVRIAEDGEILVRHKAIIKGYYKDEEQRAAPSSTAGSTRATWGRSTRGLPEDHGPQKDSSSRRAQEHRPQYIENLLKFSPYINDAVVIGDRRKFSPPSSSSTRTTS